jgi:hypothetical protein
MTIPFCCTSRHKKRNLDASNAAVPNLLENKMRKQAYYTACRAGTCSAVQQACSGLLEKPAEDISVPQGKPVRSIAYYTPLLANHLVSRGLGQIPLWLTKKALPQRSLPDCAEAVPLSAMQPKPMYRLKREQKARLDLLIGNGSF